VTFDIGPAREAEAVTFGEPGRRTFCLRLIGATGQTAALWLEKEHVQALALAFRQILAQTGYRDEPRPVAASAFPETPDHDIRVGTMGVGFDPSDATAVVQVGEMGSDEDDRLRARLSLGQCAALALRLEEIVAAGRPLCPLCGAALDPAGHVCIRSNGHSRQPIPDEGEGEDSD
jgi:uncharacterized repeat protein (TIGR03847 family)